MLCGLEDIFDSTPDSILAYKLTKDTITRKPHTLRLSIPLLDGTFLLIFHCNPMLHALKHACKHFYGIQHSFTFHCHQPSLIPEFGSHTHFCSMIPLQEGRLTLTFNRIQYRERKRTPYFYFGGGKKSLKTRRKKERKEKDKQKNKNKNKNKKQKFQ